MTTHSGKCSALHPVILHPHEAIPKKKEQCNLTREEKPVECIVDSDKHFNADRNSPDEPVPTTAEETQPEPASTPYTAYLPQ